MCETGDIRSDGFNDALWRTNVFDSRVCFVCQFLQGRSQQSNTTQIWVLEYHFGPWLITSGLQKRQDTEVDTPVCHCWNLTVIPTENIRDLAFSESNG